MFHGRFRIFLHFVPIKYFLAMGWFPQQKGLSVGIVVGGFGLGALVFNYITTSIINPKNVSPVHLTPER